MTALEDEKEEPELLIPPSWDEVEADEEYQALSPMKKQVVLSNWTQAINNYAKATGEYEADPEAGRAVADFAKRKTSEFSQNFDAAVESGLYEDNLWGGAKRLGDRAALGAMQVAPNAIALANRAAELTVQAPELMTGLLDSVGLNKLLPIDSVRENGITQAYRDFSAPLRETFRQSADAARAETNEMAAAGAAIGGGFAGEAVQAVVPAAAEAVQDMAVAIGSGGSSVPRTLAKPFEAAIRSLNVSSILGGVRSALPTLDAAEAQYMQEDPTLTREQARMKALPEALTSGASTALVTRLGGFTGIESVLVQGGPKALRGRVLEVLKQAASEGLEEATDQSLQDLSERFYRNPEKAWADTYKELAMAYTLGSVLGGGFSAASQTLSAVAENAKANDAPQTAAVLRQRAEQEAAIRTAKLFGDENAAKEAEDLEKEILGDLESEDGMDDTNEDGAPAGDADVSGATGVISGDTTSTGTEGQTTTPAPTLRESVIASGIPEDAADAYISNLQAEGLADEQIQEIADNTRALREEAARKNEADAEARREVARRARAGDPEARAQLERERGINVTTSEPTVTTPEPEPQSQEPGRQFVDLGGPAPQFQGGTNLLTGQPETPTLLAPEVSPQQQTTTTPTPTNEGGEFNEEGQLRMRGQEGQGRRPEGLTPTPTDSGAGAEGDVATPPPTEAPAPLPETPAAEQPATETQTTEQQTAEQQVTEPETTEQQVTEQQGDRVTTATGAKGVISKKPLPVEEVQTGTDEQGRPITRVVPRFVNDPDTLAESLHQNGGAERIYIPDEVIDDEQIDDDNIGFAFEKGTGRAYVTWARHSRYPDAPVMENGRTEDNATLEQLYQNDPKRQERSEAQTKGEGVKLTENSQEFSDKLAEAPMSELERNEPQTVQRELASIQRLASELAEETVTTNSGEVATIGPALADEIASAATNLYLARLRGVVSGEFADAAGVVRDVKAKAVRALRSRGAGNAAVSLDQQIGDGTNTRGDVVEDTNAQEPGMTQVELDEQESQAPAEAQIEQERTQPQDVSEALQFALDMAVMDLSDADRATWLEYKKRTTEKREGGKGAYRLTNEQKRVAELVRQKANDMLVEDLAQERDVDDETGALKPAQEPILTEAEKAQMDLLNKRVDEREAQRIEDRVRRNTREVLAMAQVGEGGRIDIRTILQTLANDKKQSALVRYFANWLAKSPHDFGNVKLQLIANRNKRANWAGLYKAGSKASSGTIQINTASEHRGGIGQTVLHEALHHIVLYKIRPSYKRNAVEKAAYRDLMKILTHARKQLLMPEQGETLSQTARREFGSDDTFYGLTNLDELFTETLTNERFFAWLNSQDAIPGLRTKGTFRTLWSQLKQAFHNFVYGVQVRPDSLLAQSLDNIMALSRDPQTDRKIREYNNTVAQRKRMVAESVRGNPQKLKGREMMEVLENAVAENPEVPMLAADRFEEAKSLLIAQINNPQAEVKSRGGMPVSLYSPDKSTAKYLGMGDAIEARAIHLLTDDRDRTTPDPEKIRTANLIPQTLRQADFVGYYDWSSPTGPVSMLVYAKLYNDSDSPTGKRWHFVEVRDFGDTATLETQYSNTDPSLNRATRSLVQWVGDAAKNKKRDGGAGHAQGLPGNSPQKTQGMLPDVSPTARENIDTTADESVQLEILEAVAALTEKRARLLAQQSYTEAGQVDEQIRQLEERFSQSPTPPSAASIPSQPTRAQIRRMKKTSAGWKASGWFGQGLMDMRVFKRETQRDSEIRAANYRVTETARRFNRQVKQSGVNAQVLRDALGTTENRLTDPQYDQFKKMQRAAKRETDPVKRQAAQQAADQFRITQVRANNQAIRAKQQAALAQLPAELRGTVLEMRKHLDGFTKTIVSKGMVGSDLQTTLGDNLEVYLTRSYEIFDNPEWSDFIQTDQSPESIVVRNDAQRLFRSQLVAEEARRIRRNAKMANQPVPTRQQALAAAQATVTQNDVDTMMQDYLRKGDSPSVAILGGRLPGKKDMSIMKLRGQIPKEIRALWGEYKDPEVNYARTYMNMARFVAEHSFQQDFLDMGLNSPTPFLWKEGVSTTPKPPHWVPVYPGLSDSPNPNPMAGVYGPEIIGQAFKDMEVQIKHPMVNEWLMGLTGFSMAAKTVYNVPQSNVRNFLGNGLLMFAQGYLGADITKLGFLNRMATSAKVTGPQAVGLRPERNAAVTDYVERLIGLGVMGDNVKANVVKELTSVVFDRNPSKAFGEKAAMAWKFVKGANERVTDAYQAADDFWKIVAFESERSLMEKAYPNATPESLDRMAADRVRDVVPTYSMIPKIVQDLVKKQPYFAPFISWTSEIIRTTANTYRIGWQDATSGNPALQVSGLYRLGLATTAQVALGAVAYMVRGMMGVSEEDEERLRRFLPEWQVNALLMITGKKEDGKISFWDLSYLNPYNVLQEPFIAVSRELASGSGSLSAAAAGAQKLLDPWTGEQLLFGAIMDVSRGVTVDGNPLYEKADTEWNKNKARLNRIASALTPGSVNIGTRIYKAFTGTIERSGRSYDLSNELIGPIIGQRLTENDPMQSFQIGKIPKFKGMMQSAANLATREFRTRGTPDLTKIRENYVQSNDARMKAFSEIKKDVDALIGLGVPESKVWGALAAAELSKDDLRQIQNGVYVRRAPSNDALENAVGTPDFQKKIQAMREAIAGYPETQTLIDPE